MIYRKADSHTTRALNNARVFFSPAEISAGLLLWLLLLTVFMIYQPGIAPGFLFDDYININALGNAGTIDNWRSALQFVLSANSSSTGRPVSVASFLLNDNAWPSSAESFKYTNVLIHMLAGALLAWLFYLVAQALGYDQRRAGLLAVAAAALWLLHPLHVSTVLYPVQRMALLAALFVILGLVLYVRGRLALAQNGRPSKAFLYMFLGVGVCTPVAVMSKENGGLLPLLALVLEASVLRQLPVPFWQHWRLRLFKGVFLVLPLMLLVAYFVLTWDEKVTEPYLIKRSFTLYERLLTEGRILLDYLGKLLLPRMQTSGLYYDNYPLSTSWLSPPATLLSLALVVALMAVGFIARKRRPVLAAAILFFFAGHIIESSFIPLELYFEHRNYLPSVFLFFALTLTVSMLGARARRPKAALVGLALVAIVYGSFTYTRASLWSDVDRLGLVWAQENPGSVRTQQQAAIIWNKYGRRDKAVEYLQRAIDNSPDRLVLRLQELSLHCGAAQIEQGKLDEILAVAGRNILDEYAGNTIEEIISIKSRGNCPAISYGFIIDVLEATLANPFGKMLAGRVQHVHHLQAQVYLNQRDYQLAAEYLIKAFEVFPDTEAGLQFVALLATHRQYDYALDLLDRIEGYQSRTTPLVLADRNILLNNVRNLDAEIDRIRTQLVQDAAEQRAPN